MRDPYTVLGVAKGAAQKDIKSAFRKLAKKHHPDQNQDDPKAQTKFAEVNQAYEIVGDEKRRAAFDRGEIDAEGKERFQGFEGAGADPFAGFRRAGGGPGGGQFEFRTGPGGNPFGGDGADVFSELFGQAFAGQAGGGAARQQKGPDLEVALAVSLEEVVGAAKVTAVFPQGRKVAVKLPRFVEDGQVIRLKGQGHPSPVGRGNGDALVKLRFKRHPRFRVDGHDLQAVMTVCLEDAVLGTKQPFETLSGKIAITVPPWSSSGKVFRLKGRGLPKKNGSDGDMLVELRVDLPKGDAELEALMKKRRG
ncbi:MAG: J domain-containing protein [Hyphomicrobiales bacterium]|nr:J domain-containing protein [Hyphomicrobiales bacterium]